MTTRYDDTMQFYKIVSLTNLANSAIGAGATVGNYGWSISNLTTFNHTLSGSESTAATIAKQLATLIYDLAHRGIIRATGLPG